MQSTRSLKDIYSAFSELQVLKLQTYERFLSNPESKSYDLNIHSSFGREIDSLASRQLKTLRGQYFLQTLKDQEEERFVTTLMSFSRYERFTFQGYSQIKESFLKEKPQVRQITEAFYHANQKIPTILPENVESIKLSIRNAEFDILRLSQKLNIKLEPEIDSSTLKTYQETRDSFLSSDES